MLENLPDAVIVVDEASAPIHLNAAARRLGAGGPDSTASLRGILELDAAAAAALEDGVRAVLQGAQSQVDLACTVRGAERLSISIVPSGDDGARGALVICRKVISPAPDPAMERLQHVLDASAEAVCLLDGSIVIDANPAMARIFGYAPDELRGLHVDALLAPAHGNLEAHVAADREHTFDATAHPKGTSTFAAEVVSRPVGAPARGLHGLTIRDVTAHRATAQAFRDSEERFRLISELSSEGLVLTERGVIFHANNAMTKIFGYSREELIGMQAKDLTAAEDHQIAAAHILSGSEEPYEATGVRKDRSTLVGSISAINLPYQDRMVRGSRICDISAQRQADEARRQNIIHEEKLRIQADRLAEMSTPLISITDEILAMPLIGTMDMARARQALRTMLDGIASRDAHTAIVDITGISGIDTSVVASLVRMAQAVRLQGAEVVLTGIRAQVADTLVALGVDLSGIVIRGSFQDGIRYAMKRASPRERR